MLLQILEESPTFHTAIPTSVKSPNADFIAARSVWNCQVTADREAIIVRWFRWMNASRCAKSCSEKRSLTP